MNNTKKICVLASAMFASLALCAYPYHHHHYQYCFYLRVLQENR